MSTLVILSTTPSKEVAQTIAKALLEHKLAACVSFQEGTTSVFEWEGAIKEEQEVLLYIKTKATLFSAVEELILTLHPYDVPEIVALKITHGHAPYLSWVHSVTKDPS